MKKLINLLTLIFLFSSACGLEVENTEQETHAWGQYHWASWNTDISISDDFNSPIWRPYFDKTLQDWNNLSTPLNLTEYFGDNPEISVVVRPGNGWLGLAEIQLGGLGHIVAGRVSLSPKLLSTEDGYNSNAAQHVFCQEVGHILGLHHTTEISCMDDCSWAFGEGWLQCINDHARAVPNSHDEEQLNMAYDHIDARAPMVDETREAFDCSGNLAHPSCITKGWTTVHEFKVVQ